MFRLGFIFKIINPACGDEENHQGNKREDDKIVLDDFKRGAKPVEGAGNG